MCLGESTSFPPTRARRDASQGTCTCQKPGLGTFDNDSDDDDNEDNDNDNDDDKNDDKNDDDNDGFCFLARDEVGMRQAGCASPEQSVLSITVSSVNTKEPVLMIESLDSVAQTSLQTDSWLLPKHCSCTHSF